jgi:hypothetical protein
MVARVATVHVVDAFGYDLAEPKHIVRRLEFFAKRQGRSQRGCYRTRETDSLPLVAWFLDRRKRFLPFAG